MTRTILNVLVQKRMVILATLGIGLYVSVMQFQISLWWVLVAGVLLGTIFGKVFCRWVCPLGLVMEVMMNMSSSGKVRQMYQYHKIGCPIAWISGWLNKYSAMRIQFNADTCRTCGKCDTQCYIVAMEPARFSFYKPDMTMPGSSYTCSKCLQCVVSCPNESLKYTIVHHSERFMHERAAARQSASRS